MIGIQPSYWCVGRIYRKHIFFYFCVLDRVYRAIAWQGVDQIRYSVQYKEKLKIPESDSEYLFRPLKAVP
jgi:hypothetical protein